MTHEVLGNGGGMTVSCEEYEAYVEAERDRLREAGRKFLADLDSNGGMPQAVERFRGALSERSHSGHSNATDADDFGEDTSLTDP